MNTTSTAQNNGHEPAPAIASAEEVLAAARALRKQAQDPTYAPTGSCEVHGDLSADTNK